MVEVVSGSSSVEVESDEGDEGETVTEEDSSTSFATVDVCTVWVAMVEVRVLVGTSVVTESETMVSYMVMVEVKVISEVYSYSSSDEAASEAEEAASLAEETAEVSEVATVKVVEGKVIVM